MRSFMSKFEDVIFCFTKANNSSIAVVMVELFAVGKGKKNESKNRKAMWFEYIMPCAHL